MAVVKEHRRDGEVVCRFDRTAKWYGRVTVDVSKERSKPSVLGLSHLGTFPRHRKGEDSPRS